ncbi:MAG: 4Fe-4S binding protein [Armatimonadota bacterium]
MYDRWLTDQIKSLALDFGADLVGIADAERYAEAPIEMSPEGHLPGATSVVVVAIHHPDAAIELSGESHPQDMGPYSIQMSMNYKLECVSFQLARWLEDHGHSVVAIPATNIWHYRPRGSVKETFAPDLSDIHAAAAAGLGEIGYSGLLMTPEYGPRQRFCCLVTDAPLEPDPMYDGPELCDRCMECVKECPTEALTKETAGEHHIRIGEKEFSYANKNKWRCAWAEHFALDLDLDLPETVDEKAILENLDKHGRRGGAMGRCIKVCLPPHLRYDDPDYSSTVRRRRQPQANEELADGFDYPDRPATLRAVQVLHDRSVDMLSVVSADTCRERGFDITDELPDGRSMIVFGYGYDASLQDPTSSDNDPRPVAPSARAITDWLGFTELEVCQQLERLGYSALPGRHLDAETVARVSGLVSDFNDAGRPITEEFGPRVSLCAVLTGAPLQERTYEYESKTETDPASALDLRFAAQYNAVGWGADLFGVAEPWVIDDMADAYQAQIDEEPMKWTLHDRRRPHGPVDAELQRDEDAHIRRVDEILPGAQSVIVVGYHFPFLNILRGAEPPANAVGPYAYATYQTNRWLRYIGTAIARELHQQGYHAVVSDDVANSGSRVANPRGEQPDALCNRFAAAAAGLAHIGLHGAPITPQFGVAQRFIAVVTDAPIMTDEPLQDISPCEGCDRPCISACPVKALGEDTLTVGVNGSCTEIAAWERLRCEWAKRYALVGDEGPRWIGQITDIMPPEGEVSPEDILDAYEQKDPVQKHLTCILEPCLKACQRKWLEW